MAHKPVTYVYIDAFNLYYGCLKGTPHKWLDLTQLCRLLLPANDVRETRYFTALVKPRPKDPTQRLRQETYIRALGTRPGFSVYYGHFLSNKVTLPLAQPTKGYKFAQVIRTEENGSDVNPATHLLFDAFQNAYDTAVVISNDSDLLEPVRIVREEFGKVVGVIDPQQTGGGVFIGKVDFTKRIRQGVLVNSQLPNQLQDARGPILKPAAW